MTTVTSPAPPAPPVRGKVSGLSLGVFLFRLRALIALFVLIAIFSGLTPSFFTEQNLIILVGQTAINAIMAVGHDLRYFNRRHRSISRLHGRIRRDDVRPAY